MKNSKNIEIKHKFINHLTIDGKKNKSEGIVFQSLKVLQKTSKKSSKKLMKLALGHGIPIFRLHSVTKKKKKKQKPRFIPTFVHSKTSRISFSIKFIVKIAKKAQAQSFFKKLTKELLFSAKNKSNSIEIKKEIQKEVLFNRHFFKYYRWH